MYEYYLVHHGIKGQKWGVRRYQNDDGTLTTAGKARYGGQREYGDSAVRRLLTGERTVAKLKTASGEKGRVTVTTNGARSGIYSKKADSYRFKAEEAAYRGNEKKAQKMAEKADRAERRAEAYKNLMYDRMAYDRHTSTGKLYAQNYLMNGWGAESYRNSRAMGNSRGRAFADSIFGVSAKRVEEHYNGG